MHTNPIVNRVVEALGGSTAAARALGISRQAVDQWKNVPAKHMAAIKDLTGIPVLEMVPLRQDVSKQDEAAA